MTRSLKIHFVLWCVLSINVAIGALAFDLSSSPTFASLVLRPGESIDIPVFRVFSEKIRIELGFKNTTLMRPELGSHVNMNGQKKTDVLEFPNLGEPIKLLLRNKASEVICEAWPGSSFSGGGKRTGRILVPYVEDGNPNLFPEQDNPTELLVVPTGNSKLTIIVLEAGKSISGERVDVLIRPPISLKHIAPRYGFLSWFLFWPIYAFVLVIYGAMLIRSYRHHRLSINVTGTSTSQNSLPSLP